MHVAVVVGVGGGGAHVQLAPPSLSHWNKPGAGWLYSLVLSNRVTIISYFTKVDLFGIDFYSGTWSFLFKVKVNPVLLSSFSRVRKACYLVTGACAPLASSGPSGGPTHSGHYTTGYTSVVGRGQGLRHSIDNITFSV